MTDSTNPHTVRAYGDELNQITSDVARMGGLAEAQIADAIEAMARRDQALAQEEAARQQLATYRSTLGRQAEVKGAEADLQAATALAAQKRWVVERKAVSAPAAMLSL